MMPKNAVIKGAYFHDLLGQPQALQDTLDGLEVSAELRTLAAALAGGKFHRIVLTGMGASLHALHPLNLRLIDRGFNSLMVFRWEMDIILTAKYMYPRSTNIDGFITL